MPKGESIESLLEPSLRVSRPVAACSRCRSAKIKCTWGISACSACERSGKASSCTSANEEFARGNERSYVAALENAVERLQRKVDAARGSTEQSMPNSDPRRNSKTRTISGPQRKEASDVNELVSDFGFLTVNATSRDFHGFHSSVSFAKLLLAMAVKANLTTDTSAKLPPRHVVMQSTVRYFDSLFVMLPFFSEIEFMSSVSRVYQDAISSTATALDFWYVRLVLAITHSSQSRVRGDDHDRSALQHVSAAMQLAERVLRPGSVSGVQALLLLVQYAQCDPERLDSWYLMGMAARLVVDLGLHCDLPAEAKVSTAELNMRRRIFHSVYALDRIISMSTGRPFSFTDDSATGVPFPDLGTESTSSSSLGVFLRPLQQCLYLFDIRRIQSSFYQTTRFASRVQWTQTETVSFSNSAASDVERWYASVPSTLLPQHLTVLRLESTYAHILILAPHQRRPVAFQTDANKLKLFGYCSQFTELLHPAVYDVDYLPFLSDADLLRARWISRLFLQLVWSDYNLVLRSNTVDAAGQYSRAISCIRNLTDILDIARQRWSKAESRQQFEKESAVLATRLTTKLNELSPSITNTGHASSGEMIYQPQGYFNLHPHAGFEYDLQPERVTGAGSSTGYYVTGGQRN